jgi:non-specific serine/threonine protein kinase
MGFALARAEGSWAYMADIELAERAFRRAVAIGSVSGSEVPAGQLLKARSSLALTLMRLGRADEAEPIARAIVADSTRIRGADHPDTLVTRQHWLTSLSMTGRHREALEGSTPLLAAMGKRFGPDHSFTLALHSTRFESYSALGRYPEAAREAEIVWKGAAAKAGPSSHQALVGQIDYASALCQTPQKQQALGVARAALDTSRAGLGADYPLTHAIRYFTAECLITDGRFAEARQMLDGIGRDKVAQLIGNPDFDATVDVALAEIAFGERDKGEAKRMLDRAGPSLAKTKDERLRARAETLGRSLAT